MPDASPTLPTPEPLNRVADQMEKAMVDKMKALLTPLQDGARATVTTEGVVPQQPVANASAQPKSTPTAAQPATPAVTTPAPVSTPIADPAIPATDVPPEGASKATKEDWNRFRALKNAEIEKRDKELADIRKELEKLKGGRAIDPLEYESTKKTKEELEATVERLRLEESPKFKSYYDGGIEKQIKLIKAVGGQYGEELVKLVSGGRSKERNERLREIQEELGPEGNIVGNALGEIARLQHERGEQLANWKENSKRLKEVEQREMEATQMQTAEKRKSIADRLVASAKGLPEFTAANGDTNHAAFSDSALTFIRNAAEGKLGDEDTMLLPVAAMKAQYLETIKLPKIEAENAALKARIAELTGARPQINGQQSRPAQPANTLIRDANDPYGVGAATKRFNELMGRS